MLKRVSCARARSGEDATGCDVFVIAAKTRGVTRLSFRVWDSPSRRTMNEPVPTTALNVETLLLEKEQLQKKVDELTQQLADVTAPRYMQEARRPLRSRSCASTCSSDSTRRTST